MDWKATFCPFRHKADGYLKRGQPIEFIGNARSPLTQYLRVLSQDILESTLRSAVREARESLVGAVRGR